MRANQAAVGALPESGAARFEFAFSGEGLTGTASSTQDIATGAYVDTQKAGPISEGAGYDGKTPWMRDLSGANTAQEGGDRIAVAVNQAYRNANLWWRADHSGASIRYVGREDLNGALNDHLVVTPNGGKRFDAWFDSNTHLLTQIAEDRQFFHTREIYSDYRRENGFTVAHKWVEDGGTGKDNYDTLILQKLTIGPAQPISAYSRPTAPPAGATIDGNAASVTVPFRLPNNHIYVEGTVNGKGPYTFILDTGGHNLLSQKVIKDIGLNSVGSSVGSGAGKGTVLSGFAKVSDIAIGGVHLHDQTAIVQNVYDKSVEGIPVDAMVGFELIRRMVTRIDYGARTLTFTDPSRFKPLDAGKAVPFKFYDHLPQVEGEAAGIAGIFDIDTGSRSEVDITSPSVEQYKLRQKYSNGITAVTGWGVGGPVESYVVRLPSLTLGGLKEDNVVADLDSPHSGSMSDPNFLGNIGSGFLKRFIVTLDYAHQTMYLKQIVPRPADIGTFDRSGMWINASDDGYMVNSVSARGPAADAGLQKGDVITAIDGKRVKPEQLATARALLRTRPAGSKIMIEFRRGTEEKHALVTLRDQI
ncbi:MAG TPA: aspartyl protease family protein [Rhizomicrobium sp.]|nr:aspartyl protease family protein [Rhizomicrobium sp.]